jgi:hypothetical protein
MRRDVAALMDETEDRERSLWDGEKSDCGGTLDSRHTGPADGLFSSDVGVACI